MAYTTLIARQDGAVLHLTLNRPEVRNAMSLAMVLELRQALGHAEHDGSTRAIVLRGTGGHFCAGGDIKDMATARAKLSDHPNAIAEVNAAFGELCVAYAGTGLAVVAVLQGTVMGGGFGLACVADVTLADENVVFRLPETSLGLVPAQVGPFLVERLGYAEAKRLAVTGAQVDSQEALRLRLVHQVLADEEGLDGALQGVLADILKCAPGALAATKQLIAKARLHSPASLVHEAAETFARAALGPEGQEGTLAFLGKRKAAWMPRHGACMSFSKILVANRGEIACRVMRTSHRLGYPTVAVYSQADARATHVALADQAVCIGAPPAAASYLNIDALLDAAHRTGADAIHPGYGFLSERADFAEACAAAGLVFIGPPASAIRAMGNKSLAKRRMIEAGVPCAPGYLGDDQNDERLQAEAARLGLPLLVKAVAGGGGRGMRLVRHAGELAQALAGARREAQSAFGDGTLMLERLIDDGRHIEIQVFCDAHGNAVHLGERDCTAQRRRQKVIEEAPSPVVGPDMRAAMGRDAVAAALAVGYRGAGTVEFIVDADNRHYFLEMNTRLQVEHPVTECITGFDLVEWQLRVAAGEPLPVTQDQVTFSGHAIEVRLYAEDPYDGWTPQTGPVLGWAPQRSPVRIDHGLAVGGEVTPYYDAMVAKFIAHGRDRADATRRLVRALDEVPLIGLVNNGRFLRDLLLHPQFQAAQLTTTRLDEWAAAGEPLLQRPAPSERAWRLAAALRSGPGSVTGEVASRPASVARFALTLHCQGEQRTLSAPPEGLDIVAMEADVVRYSDAGVLQRAIAITAGDTLHLALDGAVFCFTEASPYPKVDTAADPRRARAPVAGVVAQVSVAVGDRVSAGQALVCVEAMKMEMWLHAGAAGTVRAVNVKPKDAVASGAVLVELEIAA